MTKNEYRSIHHWLEYHFGKADKCESLSCKHESQKYHWAKVTGKEYERVRENFIKLCLPCHVIYDKITRRTSLKKAWEKRSHTMSPEQKEKLRLAKVGKKRPPRTAAWRINQRQAIQLWWDIRRGKISV